MKTLTIILAFHFLVFANEQLDYNKLFSKLEEKGVILGKDIDINEVFAVLEGGNYYTNGLFDPIKLEAILDQYIKSKTNNVKYDPKLNLYPSPEETFEIIKQATNEIYGNQKVKEGINKEDNLQGLIYKIKDFLQQFRKEYQKDE